MGALASPPPGRFPHDEQGAVRPQGVHTEQRCAGRGGGGRGASCLGDCLGGSLKEASSPAAQGLWHLVVIAAEAVVGVVVVVIAVIVVVVVVVVVVR